MASSQSNPVGGGGPSRIGSSPPDREPCAPEEKDLPSKQSTQRDAVLAIKIDAPGFVPGSKSEVHAAVGQPPAKARMQSSSGRLLTEALMVISLPIVMAIIVLSVGHDNVEWKHFQMTAVLTYLLIRSQIQQVIQWRLSKHSGAFAQMTDRQQRNDACVSTNFVLGFFWAPVGLYFFSRAISDGPAVLGSSHASMCQTLLFAAIADQLYDLPQRERAIPVLILHHLVEYAVVLLLMDWWPGSNAQSGALSDVGLYIVAAQQGFDRFLWFIVPLEHLVRQNAKPSKEGESETPTLLDAAMQSPRMRHSMQLIYGVCFCYYTIFLRLFVTAGLIAYLARFWDIIPTGWKVVLPIVYIGFVVVDYNVYALLYRRATRPHSTVRVVPV